jgi:hypothetical protein
MTLKTTQSDRQNAEESKLEALRQAIRLGIQDADAGRTIILEPTQVGRFLRGLSRTTRV